MISSSATQAIVGVEPDAGSRLNQPPEAGHELRDAEAEYDRDQDG
jgi:hypothetical protein